MDFLCSEPPVEATISNCFITNNIVGIGIWKDDKDFIHFPRIVNNTIAWNEVGVYNSAIVATPGVGMNKPMLINNVFDVSTPIQYQALGYIMGISSFEGIDAQDRTVLSTPAGTANIDFNSYEVPPQGWAARQNLGDTTTTPPYSWPRTQSRAVGQTYVPRVNLYVYTQTPMGYGAYAGQRGALYINDVFRMDTTIPMISIHDYRLSPTAIRGDNAARLINPLIGQGVDLGYANGQPVHIGTIVMQNLTTTLYSPGLPPPGFAGSAEDLVPINAWDDDADGFGNPRVEMRRYGPNPTLWGRIDLGADESAEVTISGYIESTRIFSRPHPQIASNTGSIVGGISVYFFNLYHGASNPNNTYWRYESNFPMDLVYTTPHQRPTGTEWYNQIVTNPYGTTSNYTNGGFDNRVLGGTVKRAERNQWVSGGTHNKPEFLRNLFCDISPHLHYDFPPRFVSGLLFPPLTFPHWGEYIRFLANPAYRPYALYDDIFHSNPWFEGTNFAQAQYDNAQLFYDPASMNSWPLASIVKPPLTVPQNTWSAGDKSYLLANQNHAIWLFEWPNNNAWVYTVNNFGWGGPDAPPFQSPWHGARFNCQLLDPNNPQWGQLGVGKNNLQTFLVVEGTGGTAFGLSGGSGQKSSSSQITSYSNPDRDIYPGSKIYKPLMKAFREFLRKKGQNK